MATEVDICNMALAYLGDRANVTSIDPPEGSAQADHCARFYPIARNQILAEHSWAFATRRVKLAKVVSAPLKTKNAFALPSDCIRVVSVHDTAAPDDRYVENFTIENQNEFTVVTCNCDEIFIKYISHNISASTFPPMFSDALAHLLASKLAGPLVTGTSGANLAQEEMKIYEAFLSRAIKQDALQFNEHEVYVNPFVGDLLQGEKYGAN